MSTLPSSAGANGAGTNGAGTNPVAVSIVLPCLNEADSVAQCVKQAFDGIRATGLAGEVIVVDNGSTDGSADLASKAGATVVHESRRGYGSAYLSGFAVARGKFLVMGDADSSYDFAEIPHLVSMLADGYDYVVGSRFTGDILRGAMPWTHRYLGNPVLTGVLNLLFGTRLSDAHSGLRAMTRGAYERMDLRCTGMEFASEIAVRAAQAELRSIEVPITYHPRAGESKLRPLQDGWRHLVFLVSMLPGLMMIMPGLLILAVAAGAVAAVQPWLLRASPGESLALTILFTFVVLVSGQVVALGATTHLHSLKLGKDGVSQISRSLQRMLRSSHVQVVGVVLFVLGLTAELVSLLTVSSHPIDLADAHLRYSVISLTTMMLGAQLYIAVSHLNRVNAGPSAALPGSLLLAAQSADGREQVALPLRGGEENGQRPERLSR
jgi:hypothetical protein